MKAFIALNNPIKWIMAGYKRRFYAAIEKKARKDDEFYSSRMRRQ